MIRTQPRFTLLVFFFLFGLHVLPLHSSPMRRAVSSVTMNHTALSSLSEQMLDVSLHQTGSACVAQFGPLRIKMKLDLGKDYNLGELAFSSAVNVTVTTYSDLSTPIQSWTVPFTLSQSSPEQLFIRTLPGNTTQVKYVKIKINSYTNTTVAAQNAIRLRAWTEEEDVVGVNGVVVSRSEFNVDNTSWEQTFSWTTSCSQIPDYIFQLLRIYGSESVDWNKALSIHTESSATSITLTIGEGDGVYRWRVIPLGNQSGGISNSLNWGEPSTPSDPFVYTHPENGKNWIYSRTFTEGNRVSEQVTYANGLQMVAQQQSRIQGDNQIVASQTYQDYVGRNAVNSLPVPVAGASKLKYVPGLLKNSTTGDLYRTGDFDTNPKDPATATDLGGYYSEGAAASSINTGVAHAKGYPFTQTVFAPDGKVREQSGVGYTHSVAGGKIVRTFYSKPSDTELLRLFGKETPEPGSVQKITTFDANGQASISYQTKDGKVIATALAVTSASSPLTALTSASSATVSINEEVQGTQRTDDHTLISRRPLFVESDRALTVDYQIAPSVIQQMCGNTSISPCKTCDYKVELLLFKEGDLVPVVLGSRNIESVGCSGQSTVNWDPAPFPQVTLSGGINYVLEKRITLETFNTATSKTYLQEQLAQIENGYRTQYDASMSAINSKLATGDIAGLYSSLGQPVDNQYIVPLLPGATGDCQDYLYVPVLEPCPAEIVVDPNSTDFEGYFAAYYAGHATIIPETNGMLSYVFFKNLGNDVNHYFAKDQFNTMVANMIADNGLNRELVWNAWKQEVQGYEARAGSLENTVDATFPFATLENNMLQNFITGIEALLQQTLAQDQASLEAKDICLNRPSSSNPYFIKKAQLYGSFRQIAGGAMVVVSPNLLYAYRLAYFNNEIRNQNMALKFYRGNYTKEQIEDNTVIPSQQDFDALSECDRYRFATNTQMGNEEVPEEKIEENIEKVRENCGKACEARGGDFRQAIIRSLLTQNPSTLIEHYNVYVDGNLDADPIQAGKQPMYVGVLDIAVNNGTGNYTLSECELDAMVDKLIINCKNTYCATSLTIHDEPHPDKPGFTTRVYGTQQEWDQLSKPIEFDFEVNVGTAGQGCASGFDLVTQGQTSLGWQAAKVVFGFGDSLPGVTVQKIEYLNGYYYALFRLDGLQVNLNNGTSVSTDYPADWTGDYLLVKFSPQGDIIWKRSIDITQNLNTAGSSARTTSSVNALSTSPELESSSPLISFSIDPESEKIILNIEQNGGDQTMPVTIKFNGKVVFNRTEPMATYLAQIDQSGNLIWIKKLLGSASISGNLIVDSNSIYRYYSRYTSSTGTMPAGVEKRSLNTGERDNTFTFDDYFVSASSSSLASTGVGNLIAHGGGFYLISGTSTDNPLAPVTVTHRVNGVTVGTRVLSTSTNKYGYSIARFNNQGVFQSITFYDSHNFLTNRFYLVNGDLFLIIQNEEATAVTTQVSNVPVTFLPREIKVFKLTGTNIYTLLQSSHVWDRVDSPNSNWIFDKDSNRLLMARPQSSSVEFLIYDFDDELFTTKTVSNVSAFVSPLLFRDEDFIGITQDVLSIPGITFQPIAGPIKIFIGQYETACPATRSLCFRFTTPKDYSITIPGGVEIAEPFNPVPEKCIDASLGLLRSAIEQQKEQLIARRLAQFREDYFNSCGNVSQLQDKLKISYSTGVHHYTLYYYDRAGNLLRTVPPEGVAFLDVSSANAIATAKNTLPNHQLVTEYQYNTLGQLINEHTPDANFDAAFASEYTRPVASASVSQVNTSKYYSTFIYNDKGQLRFSRNAKQKKEGTYSYTKYDELSRIVEVGEASAFDEALLMSKRNETGKGGFPSTGITQVTSTYYGVAFTGTALPSGYEQRYLRSRVSYATLDEDGNASTLTDLVTTVYSYDPHGNVEWLIQLLPGLSPIAIRYDYDLISGKVLQVKYNPGWSDQFFHKYHYDANNRIDTVYTSQEGSLWERDATYQYYKHGPLKRTVIGEDLVQGLDYTYTIHGWLKGINHQYLDITTDPSRDGNSTELISGLKNQVTGRDAFGMSLQYYANDYQRTGSAFDGAHASTLLAATGRHLYNGNISTWTSNAGGWATAARYPTLNITHKGVTGYQYVYDQLNRLLTSSFVIGTAYSPNGNFAASYTYSADGNIKTAVVRGDNTNMNLDNLTYNYIPGTHRLREVTDAYTNSPADMDVESQPLNNYSYDPIGNLTADAQQGTAISWTPYGKVKQVVKGASSTKFMYDASGNRVMKKRTNASGVSTVDYYVRDASGNIMGVYERIDQGGTTGTTTLTELPLYGSDRLGVYNKPVTSNVAYVPLEPGEGRVTASVTRNAYEGLNYYYDKNATVTLGPGFNFAATQSTSFHVRAEGTPAEMEMYSRSLGNRQYELKDHLGNVRAVVGDVKLSTLVSNVPQSFEPKLLSLSNYYPFGMDQPGRMWNASGKYRYGFNGKEKDDNGEWGSTAYDYGFRIYNPSIGKFLSVDPLTKSYPWYTPYQFAGNKPIAFIDRDGLEEARPEEIAYAIFSFRPFDAQTVANNAEIAFQAAGNSGLPDPRDGQQDAFRHAFWNSLNARDIGAGNAEPFATIHETGITNPANDTKSPEYDPAAIQMDLFNNNIGRKIGALNPNATNEELAALVMQALANGELKVVTNIGATNPNKVLGVSNHPSLPAGVKVAPNYEGTYDEYNGTEDIKREKRLETLTNSGTGANHTDKSTGKKMDRKAKNAQRGTY